MLKVSERYQDVPEPNKGAIAQGSVKLNFTICFEAYVKDFQDTPQTFIQPKFLNL